jgi:exopolysaccharide biosynthesis polyprenyl glycosylphosphotransferase
MIVHRIRGIRSLLALAQVGLVTALFWLCFAFLAGVISPGSSAFIGDYAVYWVVLLAGLGLEMLARGPDKVIAPMYNSSLMSKFPIAFRQAGFALSGLLIFLALAKDHAISRTFLVGFAVLLYGVLLWSCAALPAMLARRFFYRGREIATLLVGSSERAVGLEHWLARKRQFGVRVVGLIATDASPAGNGHGIAPILGNLDRLDDILVSEKIAQVIFLELAEPELARLLLQKCERHGLRLLIVNDFAEQIRHPIACCVDEGVNLVTVCEEPLENPFNRMLKRLLDLALVALVVALVLPWLTVLVWLLQRLQSPGPLWHRQLRAGLQNRPFEIFKFRTMRVTEDVTQQATADDVRVFPAGRWLRRFSLDEMPQFLNVFRGEMSVVGPRPHLVEHNLQFAEVLANYHLRTFIKPGITGLAQVRGFRGEARTRQDISERLQSDLVYLENWSLSLDFGIILRTLWQMIRPPRTAV